MTPTSAVSWGSSPRMRGTLVVIVAGVGFSGIIPAYAGNTSHASAACSRRWDHPRVCGEHALLHALMNHVRGSSPRMRGTPTAVVVCHLVRGIIPAYAGNTRCETLFTVLRRDHPRVCGEHFFVREMDAEHTGSSPRMRGTLGSAIQAPFMLGIIPAYAGNTNDRTPIYRMRRDHPRVCGEHLIAVW